MKKIYLLCMAAFTAGNIMAASSFPSPVAKSKNNRKTELRKSGKKEFRMRVDAENVLWRPSTQFVSEWNPDDETWEESAKYLTTYDKEGRILTDEIVSLLEGEGNTFTTYEYDEYGMPVSKLVQFAEDGSDFTNYSRTVRQYDPIVHSCIISNTESLWRDDAWQEMGNCYRREVTRNAEGNVTEVVIKTLYMGEYEASQRLSIEYGEDNKASRIVSYVLTTDYDGEFVWEPEMEYKDIVWHHTNGQILSADDVSTAENGISSCVVMDADGENIVTVEYPDDKGSFNSRLVYDMGELNVSLTYVDSYGSYDYSQTEIYREEGEEDYSYTSVERYRVNEYGLETEVFAGEAEGDEEIMPTDWMKGEIESNAEYGYPDLFTVTSYDPYEDEFFNMVQIRFEDYSNVAGINGVPEDNSTAPVEYFNIQGIRVQGELTPGLYIRKQGSEVTKIMK